jgi:prephenate dehydratase
MFFVDFEGHVDDPKVKRGLNALDSKSEQLVVLGSFPIATVSG